MENGSVSFDKMRALELIVASEQLDSVKINKQVQEREEGGHFQALAQAISEGWQHHPLEANTINVWRHMITQESAEKDGILEQIESLVKKINATISAVTADRTDDRIVSLMADTLLAMDPLPRVTSTQGRISRLVLAYLSSWFRSPMIVIQPEEKKAFEKAHTNVLAMRLFLAKKVKETVFSTEGSLMHLTKASNNTYFYKDDSGEKMGVEWHQLIAAEGNWSKQLEQSTKKSL